MNYTVGLAKKLQALCSHRQQMQLVQLASISPCWSQDCQDQTALAWQPAPSQCPHRNTGKPVQTLPGLEVSPAATSLEHWVLKHKHKHPAVRLKHICNMPKKRDSVT